MASIVYAYAVGVLLSTWTGYLTSTSNAKVVCSSLALVLSFRLV